MGDEEKGTNDLERKLREFFRAEDRELGPRPGLWNRLEPRLEEQRRPGWRQRLPTISWARPAWSPVSVWRAIGASRPRQAMAASTVVALIIGLGFWGITTQSEGDAMVPVMAPQTPTQAATQTATAVGTPTPTQAAATLPPPTATATAEAPSAGGDPVAGRELYLNVPDNAAPQALWCSQCHTIEGVAAGLIGPDHTHLATEAANRTPGLSAEEYIRESIKNPEVFVAEGVPRSMPGLMTNAITEKLTDKQIEDLVAFLLTLK